LHSDVRIVEVYRLQPYGHSTGGIDIHYFDPLTSENYRAEKASGAGLCIAWSSGVVPQLQVFEPDLYRHLMVRIA
jgi:hypothetical protein